MIKHTVYKTKRGYQTTSWAAKLLLTPIYSQVSIESQYCSIPLSNRSWEKLSDIDISEWVTPEKLNLTLLECNNIRNYSKENNKGNLLYSLYHVHT